MGTSTTTPTAPVTDADRHAAEMDERLRALAQANEDLRRQVEIIRQQQEAARTAPPPVVVAEPSPPPVPGATTVLGLPLKFSGAMTLRYDYWHNSDLTDSLTRNTVNNGLRQRIRFGVEFADPKTSMVIGGLRLSTGENPNPTVPFITLGDSFRSSAFNLDQAWIAIRPLNDRSRVSLILGRMPNPTWRGTPGTLRTEMIWDDDVNPAGAALKVKILDLPDVQNLVLENVIAYYQVQETQDLRFVGLTGRTGLFMDQIKLATHFVTGALAFYDWENLNNGLSSPGIDVGAVSVQQPTNALLLAPGLNTGNSHYAYGPQNAIGFSKDAFRVLNPTLQVHVPFNSTKLGKPDVYLLGDYAYNFTARSDHRYGAGITLGTRIGDYEKESALNPLNAWVTYRHVKSDVTVAAFADSDLGAGTDYKGVEAGVSYRIIKHLMPAISYFDYYGFPLMTNHAQRLFLDVTGEF
ncbi:MAG: hypothetical protein QOI41_5148 [Myxococcales bacterium]|nr:hypothetical protein [Myxococcales bacterium]